MIRRYLFYTSSAFTCEHVAHGPLKRFREDRVEKLKVLNDLVFAHKTSNYEIRIYFDGLFEISLKRPHVSVEYSSEDFYAGIDKLRENREAVYSFLNSIPLLINSAYMIDKNVDGGIAGSFEVNDSTSLIFRNNLYFCDQSFKKRKFFRSYLAGFFPSREHLEYIETWPVMPERAFKLFAQTLDSLFVHSFEAFYALSFVSRAQVEFHNHNYESSLILGFTVAEHLVTKIHNNKYGPHPKPRVNVSDLIKILLSQGDISAAENSSITKIRDNRNDAVHRFGPGTTTAAIAVEAYEVLSRLFFLAYNFSIRFDRVISHKELNFESEI